MKNTTQYAELRQHYNPEGSALRNLQYRLLDILIAFDEFARSHDIVYSISYGTLIGAIRHNGFVPWDDDADIMMTREEWTKLKSLMSNDGRLTDDIYIKGVVRPEIHMANKGIVDIFIYDYVPDNILKDMLKTNVCRLLSLLVKCKSRLNAHFFRRPKAWFVFMPLAMPFSMHTLVFWKEKASLWFTPDKIKPEDKVCLYRTGGPRDMRVRHPYGLLLGDMIEVEFEGHSFPAIPQYDEFLRIWYGDYMQLPKLPENLGRVADCDFYDNKVKIIK